MKKILNWILLSIILLSTFGNFAFADKLDVNSQDTRAWTPKETYADSAWTWFWSTFFGWSLTWEKWIEWLLLTAATDIKNVLIAVAVLYLLILVLRIVYWQWSEDDFKKFRMWILWTTFWIVLMQMSYTAVTTMYNSDIWAVSAQALTDNIIMPLIRLLELTTSFLFITMALASFYRIVTSWGWDDGFKKWLKTVMNAVIWYMLVKISAALVYSIYWKNNCTQWLIWTTQCNNADLGSPDISETAKIISSTIKYLISFLWITTVLLIVFAWIMIIWSNWDEWRIKKWKATIKYIVIWLVLIVSSVIIFNLIIWKEWTNIVWSYR